LVNADDFYFAEAFRLRSPVPLHVRSVVLEVVVAGLHVDPESVALFAPNALAS
jgi:hypothetical protein